MTQNFSIKDPDEVIVLSFSFANLLASGETIATCVFSITEISKGTDDSGQMVSGSADISAAPIVKQQVQGGASGFDYLVRAKITTNAGRTLVGGASLPVKLGGA